MVFRFFAEPVLRIRRHGEQLARAAYELQHRKRTEIRLRCSGYRARLRRKRDPARTARDLQLSFYDAEWCFGRIAALEREAALCDANLRETRAALHSARRVRRSLELLREREWSEFLAERLRAEEAQLDELRLQAAARRGAL